MVLMVGVAQGCASGQRKATNENVRPVSVLPSDTTPMPPTNGMPIGFSVTFAAADARARAAIFQIQCAATVPRLRANGSFGAPASAPRNVYCERNADGVPLAGVFDIDTGYSRARRLIMIRLDGARPRYTGVIDTARVALSARLVRDITRDVSPAWRRLARPFTVVPMPQSDGTVEGWVIPLPTRAGREVLGGDVSFVRAADGRLQRTVDRSASWKLITVPKAGVVGLSSAEREVAAVADLVAARSLAERGRDVSVTTTIARSALVPGLDPSGSRFHWEHAPRTPE